MTKPQDPGGNYDLEERTFQFAKAVRLFVKKLPRTITNIEDGKQLVKASGSVGAKSEAKKSKAPNLKNQTTNESQDPITNGLNEAVEF